MIDQKVLYDIMVKYDNDESFRSLCDSLSNIIQNKFDKNDIITIIRFSDVIDTNEFKFIDNNVGLLEFVF